MAVRATLNYIYYTDKLIGNGSTGKVVFGRHKRSGDPCAVKLYSSGGRMEKKIQENEVRFMKNMEHKNIVKFLAVEKDTKTSDTALIMELCSEGSLQRRLSDPKFMYEMSDVEFISFSKQLVDGVSYLRMHGIVHQDIKPGNILCHKEENGRINYKIADFGSSKDILEGSALRNVYGTEEYLHPAVYKCLFITKSSYVDKYDNTELWSIGVTLYQMAAGGDLPFRVLGGREDRKCMYDIIANKKSGVISVVQQKTLTFDESTELPHSCLLSRGLKELVVDLLVGLLESNTSKQISFEAFISKCEALGNSAPVYIFEVNSATDCVVYLEDKNISYQDLRMKKKYKITPGCLLFDNSEIEETDGIPYNTTPDNPIIVVRQDEQTPELGIPDLFKVPSGVDIAFFREAYAYIIRSEIILMFYIRIQKLTVFAQKSLVKMAFEKIERLKLSIKTAVHCCEILELNKRLAVVELQQKIERVNERFAKLDFKNFEEKFIKENAECEDRECCSKLQCFVEKSRTIYERTLKSNLTHNELVMRKYDKILLQSMLDNVSSQMVGHCFAQTVLLNNKFRAWFLEYNEILKEISSLENAILSVKAIIRGLTCVNA